MLAPPDDLFEKTLSNVEEVMARGGRVVMISDAAGVARLEGRAAFGIAIPHCAPFVAPLLYAIPIQLLAYHTAVAQRHRRRPAAQPGEERDGGVTVWDEPRVAQRRTERSARGLCYAVALFDFEGAVVDGGSIWPGSRVTTTSMTVGRSRSATSPCAAPAQRLGVLDADAADPHRAGDRGVVHLRQVGGLVAAAHHRVLQRLHVARGGVVDDDHRQRRAPARRAVSSSPSVMLNPPSPHIATTGTPGGAAIAAPMPPGSP